MALLKQEHVQDLEMRIKQLQKENEEQIRKLQEEHAAMLESMQQQQQSKEPKLTVAARAELEQEIKTKSDRLLDQERQNHERSIQQLQEHHKTACEQLEAQLKAAVQKNSELEMEYKAKLEKLEATQKDNANEYRKEVEVRICT